MRYLLLLVLLLGCSTSSKPFPRCLKEIEIPTRRGEASRIHCIQWEEINQ